MPNRMSLALTALLSLSPLPPSAEPVVAALRATGLFSAVGVDWEVTGDGAGAIGKTVFGERDTLVAVPLGGIKDGDFTLGAALVENDLFGFGKKKWRQSGDSGRIPGLSRSGTQIPLPSTGRERSRETRPSPRGPSK